MSTSVNDKPSFTAYINKSATETVAFQAVNSGAVDVLQPISTSQPLKRRDRQRFCCHIKGFTAYLNKSATETRVQVRAAELLRRFTAYLNKSATETPPALSGSFGRVGFTAYLNKSATETVRKWLDMVIFQVSQPISTSQPLKPKNKQCNQEKRFCFTAYLNKSATETLINSQTL